jgi:hypothetical protein
MNNQTTMQTEPRDNVITTGAWEIWETSLGPVRLAAPVKPEFQPARLDGRNAASRVREGFSRMSAPQGLFDDEPGTPSPLNDL